MGTGGGTSGAAKRRVIFLFIVCLPLVSSRLSAESSPCPPVNSCPNHHLAAGCTPTTDVPSPPHDGGDLVPVPDMIGDQELRSASLAEAVVLALLTATKDEWTELETFLILVFSSALFALAFSEIPLRNLFPRFAQIVEMLVVIILVNGVVALRLPTKFLWVPAVCFGVSLATLIVCL